ncbi:MAG: cysteine--tRNA ligase, partial [Robiginitomaculum sp.]|nr:cysteine--tRNA ligase [Robiginitomaculum sp.]
MTLTLYNTLTRKKEVFNPTDPKRVTMYNCGPTVYSYAHIGNARAAVAADVLFRVLRHIYGAEHVVYARNITDVDDKIIKASIETGESIKAITKKFTKIYQDDLKALGCLEPTLEPRATEHMDEMIVMIETLLSEPKDKEEKYAYKADGHVFFNVRSYKKYGKLSGNTLDQLRKGERIDDEEYARKKNAAD